MLPRLAAVLALLLALPAAAVPLDPRDVPPALKPWIPWVLHGQPELACARRYDDYVRFCTWPSQLRLELDARGGRFTLLARLDAPGWLPLPGDAQTLPQDVHDEGREAPVLMREDLPALWVTAGTHRVEGRLAWSTLPESLRVPPEAGLLDLSLDGRAIPYPARDELNRIWLGRTAAPDATQAAHLSLRVFRRVDDQLPLRVETRLQIDAGGEVREELIGPVLLPGLLPLSLAGDLPARLEPDGRLRVQLRPGTWTLTLVARSGAPVQALAAPAASPGWPAQEVWSLQTQPALRLIEASGAPLTDPTQSGTPAEWQHLPAYLVEPGTTLSFNEKQRGMPDPGPDQMTLDRDLWLDFDGGGYTVRDRLAGTLARSWRLDAQAPLALGRVEVEGLPQLITRNGETSGVELRHGQLRLDADSRVSGTPGSLPVSGWSSDLQSVRLRLHLPPAWRLLAAPGADNVPDTWLSRWTLLDLFLVLIASIAALRLFGWGTATLTLLTLALTWHEPGAPRWAWLNLLAAIALLRVLPVSFEGGLLRRAVQAWQWGSLAALALIALPYAVTHARSALYPQLELDSAFSRRSQGVGPMETDIAEAVAPSILDEAAPMANEGRLDMAAPEAEIAMADSAAPPPPPAPSAAPAPIEPRRKLAYLSKPSAPAVASQSQLSIQQLAPNVLTQTGPGLPQWTWRATDLSWSGPVTAQQQFSLWLVPPWLTRTLSVASILLIVLLAARWLKLAPLRLPPLPARAAGAVLMAGLGLLLATRPAPVQAQDMPSPELLEKLRERLTEPPGCLPGCGTWSRLNLAIGGERLTLNLTAEAGIDAAFPLPVPPLVGGAQGRQWQPQSVLVDGHAADLQRSPEGRLWVRVPPGRHAVVVSGSLAGTTQLQLPLAPIPGRVEASVPGWVLSGLDADGQASSTLLLVREQASHESAAASEAEREAQALPPMLELTRTLRLGQVWTVETQARRATNTSATQLLRVPLLPGETVTGETVRVVNGQAELSFAPGEADLSWTSRLPITEALTLTAPRSSELFETWRFDISPLWRVGFSGLVPVQHQEGEWWLSRYQPWPGETLTLSIARPAAVPGQTLTLERADLQVQPGARATDVTLSLKLRSSQGGQHALPLPAELLLQSLSIDGRRQPLRQENGRLVLPLHPGAQEVQVQLRGEAGLGPLLRTPPLALGLPGVNASLHVGLPPDRWVLLLGGPALGPAVLFWGVLAVLLLVAAGLGRSRLTPLKTASWVLLGLGLSQLPPSGAAVVAGWLYALALRGRLPAHWSAWRYNAVQLLLTLWTLAALGLLFGAVANGLLGTPDMQIAGNQSTAGELHWYQDRYDHTLPGAWVLSVSIWVYRGLMLLWALWMANSLLGWLRWGWEQFSRDGLWKKIPRIAAPAAPPAAPTENPWT